MIDSPLAPRRVAYAVEGGLTLAADTYGDPAGRPVVFLHGGGQTRHAWGGAARAVAEAGWQAITIDHRGHGESDWAPDGDYTLDAFARDLTAVMKQLHDRPIVVGASLGGLTAMTAEARAAEPITRGVVLVDVTPRLEIEGVARILAFMTARPDGFASLEEAAAVIADYLPNRPRPRDLSGLAKNLRRGDDGRYRWHWDPKLMTVWNVDNYDPETRRRVLDERLAAAKRLDRVPVLLVRGRMSDVVSEEGAREFLTTVPHAEYVDLAAGHMVAGDRNDAFTAAVLDFLRRRG